jgi:hypothetical protein
MSWLQDNYGIVSILSTGENLWHQCAQCGLPTREDKGGYVDGKFFCNRDACLSDAIYDKGLATNSRAPITPNT